MRGKRVLDGAVIRPANELVYSGRGQPYRGTHITLSPAAFEKARQGYFCHRCLSDTEAAFDCPNTKAKGFFCDGFTPESLRVWLGAEFRGETELWPESRFDELRERREREAWARKRNLWLPPGAPDAA